MEEEEDGEEELEEEEEEECNLQDGAPGVVDVHVVPPEVAVGGDGRVVGVLPWRNTQ